MTLFDCICSKSSSNANWDTPETNARSAPIVQTISIAAAILCHDSKGVSKYAYIAALKHQTWRDPSRFLYIVEGPCPVQPMENLVAPPYQITSMVRCYRTKASVPPL
jgi:hypothetical protein